MKKTGYVVWIIAIILAFLIDKRTVNFLVGLRTESLNLIFFWLANNLTQLLILGIAVLFLLTSKRFRAVPALVLSFLVSGAITYVLKALIARPRPDVALGIVSFVGKTNFAFPSGHLTSIFACLPIIERKFPRLRWVWIAFGILIGFARLYSGAHYLSDLLAGAFVGYVVGINCIRLDEKYNIFSKND